jgi:hypothetical protein
MQTKPPVGVQLNRSHPLARGLVSCFLFNEVTSKTLFNHAQPGTRATQNGSPTWVNTKRGPGTLHERQCHARRGGHECSLSG